MIGELKTQLDKLKAKSERLLEVHGEHLERVDEPDQPGPQECEVSMD